MACPVCDVAMRQVEKVDVVMDVCPDCGGVWLDRDMVNRVSQRLHAVEGEWSTAQYRLPVPGGNHRKFDIFEVFDLFD